MRPEIPRVGEILVLARTLPHGSREHPSRVESIASTWRGRPELILLTSYEEGFTGDLSFFFSGLPEGVQAFQAVQFNDGRAPLEVTQNRTLSHRRSRRLRSSCSRVPKPR